MQEKEKTLNELMTDLSLKENIIRKILKQLNNFRVNKNPITERPSRKICRFFSIHILKFSSSEITIVKIKSQVASCSRQMLISSNI